VLNSAKPGLPCRNGLLRTLAWLYLFKYSGMKGWGRFVEKFGIPFALGKLSDADYNNVTKRNAVLAAMKAMGRDGAGVTSESAAVSFLSAAGQGSTEAHEQFLRYIDEIFTLTILGQLATSATAGGLSKGQAQENVRRDLLRADVVAIAEAVTRFVVRPLARMAYGLDPVKHDIEFWIDADPGVDKDAVITTWIKITQATGKLIDPKFASSEMGIPLVDGPVPQPQPAFIDLADNPRRLPRKERALLAIADEALRRTVTDAEGLAAWTGPVRQAVLAAFGDLDPDAPGAFTEFQKRAPAFLVKLPGLLQEMNTSAFEQHLSGAMLAAALNGHTTAP
jgi:phage gp29-like protein